MYLFGSRSLEMLHFLREGITLSSQADHDVDIGILPGSPMPVKQKAKLALELESLLNVARVDLCLLNEVDAFVAVNIIRGERIFAEDSYQADEYELYVLRRAGDLADLERWRLDMILKGESK